MRTEVPRKEEWLRIHYPECRLVLENDQGEICGFTSLAVAKKLPAYRSFTELSIYIGKNGRSKKRVALFFGAYRGI